MEELGHGTITFPMKIHASARVRYLLSTSHAGSVQWAAVPVSCIVEELD